MDAKALPMIAVLALLPTTADTGLSVIDIVRHTPYGLMLMPGAAGISPREADAAVRAQGARYALDWYASITREVWQS